MHEYFLKLVATCINMNRMVHVYVIVQCINNLHVRRHDLGVDSMSLLAH